MKSFITGIKTTSKVIKKFQSLKDLARKLSAPQPFEFWTQNGCHLLDFESTTKFNNIFSSQNISVGLYSITFCSQMNNNWIIVKNAKSHWLSTSQFVRPCQNLTAWGVESERNFAFLTITHKGLIWEQKIVKLAHTEIIFWWKNIIRVVL